MSGSCRSSSRTLALIVCASVLALPARARGDEPAPSPKVPMVYITVSGGAAIVSINRTGGRRPSPTDAFLLYRTSVGLALGRRDHGINGRLGPYLEVYAPYGIGFGGELQLDWKLVDRWRGGVRVAGGVSSMTSPFGGALVGGYLRYPKVRLGLDVIGARADKPTDGADKVYSYGVLVTGGVDGGRALVVTGIAATALAALGVGLLFALSGSH